MVDELAKIAEDMAALLPLFETGGSISGLLLPTEHSSRFKAMAIDAKALIDEGLGGLNDYSLNLLNAINAGSGGFFGGPSYAAVEEASQIVIAASRAIARKGSKKTPIQASRPPYIDHSRIVALKVLPKDQWDFTRLIELCREMNVAAENNCHMSTGFILRSILNHVAPIFGMETFARVVNEYPFAKSVKGSMSRLQAQGRDGADFHLHQPIRRRETLPSAAQVAFSAELDVLLGEVIRVAQGVSHAGPSGA